MDEETRRNRDKYPQIARVVDEVRRHFPGAKVVAIRPMSEGKKKMLARYEAEQRESNRGGVEKGSISRGS